MISRLFFLGLLLLNGSNSFAQTAINAPQELTSSIATKLRSIDEGSVRNLHKDNLTANSYFLDIDSPERWDSYFEAAQSKYAYVIKYALRLNLDVLKSLNLDRLAKLNDALSSFNKTLPSLVASYRASLFNASGTNTTPDNRTLEFKAIDAIYSQYQNLQRLIDTTGLSYEELKIYENDLFDRDPLEDKIKIRSSFDKIINNKDLYDLSMLTIDVMEKDEVALENK